MCYGFAWICVSVLYLLCCVLNKNCCPALDRELYASGTRVFFVSFVTRLNLGKVLLQQRTWQVKQWNRLQHWVQIRLAKVGGKVVFERNDLVPNTQPLSLTHLCLCSMLTVRCWSSQMVRKHSHTLNLPHCCYGRAIKEAICNKSKVTYLYRCTVEVAVITIGLYFRSWTFNINLLEAHWLAWKFVCKFVCMLVLCSMPYSSLFCVQLFSCQLRLAWDTVGSTSIAVWG